MAECRTPQLSRRSGDNAAYKLHLRLTFGMTEMKTLLLSAAIVAGAAAALAQGMPGLHFVENWDLDADGQVTLAEATERRGDVFLSFDSDDDGYLTAEEYAMFDEARANDMADMDGHAMGAMKQAEGGMSMMFNDSDKDGRVSRDEFVGNTGGWIAMMDRNGDGVVTTADFGRRNG